MEQNRRLHLQAAELRRDMTRQERHLWYDFLRGYSIKFRRQAVLQGYILDFYAPSVRLAVELDGGQHYDGSGLEKDQIRTTVLNCAGITVIRFTNTQIDQEFQSVCEEIERQVQTRSPGK